MCSVATNASAARARSGHSGASARTHVAADNQVCSAHQMTTRTAQCACGRVEIVVESEPLRVVACHCDFCQKRTGSVFSIHAFFAEEQLVAITGETKRYNGLEVDGVGAVGGSVVDSHFCATCGSTVYWDLILPNGYREVGVAVGNFLIQTSRCPRSSTSRRGATAGFRRFPPPTSSTPSRACNCRSVAVKTPSYDPGRDEQG